MPTVSSMPFLKPHFHSNGASAAVAYKLYSYDSTTEDALPLYKDPAGSVEYPNPWYLMLVESLMGWDSILIMKRHIN